MRPHREWGTLPGVARLDGLMPPSLHGFLAHLERLIGTHFDSMDGKNRNVTRLEINAGRVPEWD